MAARSAFRIVSLTAARALLAVLLVLAAALYWLGTEHALQWLARQAVAAAEGRLVLDGVQGSLYDRITVARAAYKDAAVDVQAREAALAWRPELLLRREVRITELQIGELRLATADTGTTEPPQLPASLELPVNVTVMDARAGRIEAGGEVVQDLHLRARARSEAHTIELVNVSVRGWRSSGSLRVEAGSPFGARGQLAINGRMLEDPIAARIKVGGTLEALQLQATTGARGATAAAAAVLRPFSPVALEKLTIDAEAVDLKRWDKSLPATSIGLSGEIAMPAPGRLEGSVRAENADFGPVDAQRLPVSRASLAFAGGAAGWTLSDIVLGIGEDGLIRGSGTIEGSSARLELELAGVAGAALHARLKPLVASGRASVVAAPDAQRVTAALEAAGARLELAVRHAGQTVTVERGELTAENARLEFTGRAALAGKREFAADAKFRGFDPSRFVEAPQANLSGSVSAQGALAPEWRVEARVALSESRLRGQTLSAGADFQSSASRLFAGEARANYGGNRLEASGRFGAPGDALKWSLAAANLKVLDPGLAGSANARGTLSGTVKQPELAFELSARGFGAAGVLAATIDAKGTLEATADGAFRVNARAGGITGRGQRLDAVQFDTQGTRSRHDITASLRGSGFDVALKGTGGLDDAWRWNGSLSALEARGRLPVKLSAPARISAGPGFFSIEGLQAEALDGRIGPVAARIESGRIATSGRMTGITAEALMALAPRTDIDPRDFAIGGRWDIALGEAASGFVELARERGDLGVRTEKNFLLGLDRLSLRVSAESNAVDAALDVDSGRVGTLAARVRTRLERRDGAWALTGDAPLDGAVTLDVRSLAWVRALVPQLDRVGGRAAARIALAGTAGRPVITGTASADAVEVRALDPGIKLAEGTLRASFDGRTLKVSRLNFKAGEGRIEAEGTADLSEGLKTFDVTARAERAQLIASPQLTVVLSGEGRAGLRELKLALEGKFKVDEGRYDLGTERKPELGEDVVVAGRTVRAAPEAKPMIVALDVTIDLNDRFTVRGGGLDAVLGGALRITTRDGALHAVGTIRTVRGDYYAFGQILTIERGEINFSGPLGNPGIDLRAGRKVHSVEVGVEVTGSIKRPVVKLVSDPAMSDSDRLGWLLLGRDPQTASAAELAILQAAALTAGNRQSTPMQKKIAEGLGLDEFGISQGGGEGLGVLALGKRLTDRLTVRFEQGLGAATGGLLKIDFLLTERWRLEGTAGAESAADVLFTLRFD